jgi:hypothetical protein
VRDVRITFKTSGGVAYFPGLSAPKTIDVSALPSDRQQEIRNLLAESRFFELPSRTPPRKGAADYQTYTIAVADDARQHTVEVSDPVPAPLGRLVDLLRELSS